MLANRALLGYNSTARKYRSKNKPHISGFSVPVPLGRHRYNRLRQPPALAVASVFPLQWTGEMSEMAVKTKRRKNKWQSYP